MLTIASINSRVWSKFLARKSLLIGMFRLRAQLRKLTSAFVISSRVSALGAVPSSNIAINDVRVMGVTRFASTPT